MEILTDDIKEKILKLIDDGITFVDLPTSYLCCNCRAVPIFHYVTPCNHLYCRDCFENVFQKRRKCRICRKDIGAKKAQDKCNEFVIYKLHVKCPNAELGCKEVVHLDTILRHLNECMFSKDKLLPKIHEAKEKKDEVVELKKDLDDLKITFQSNQELVERNNKLFEIYQTLTNENNTLVNGYLKVVENNEKQSKSIVENNERLAQDIKTLIFENHCLTERNSALVSDNEAIVVRNEKLLNDNNMMVEKNTKLVNESKAAVDKNEKLFNESMNLVTELTTKNKEALGKYEELVNQNNSLVKRTIKFNDNNEKIFNENKIMVEKNNKLVNDNKTTVDKYEESLNQNKEIVKTIEKLNNENKDLVKQNSALVINNKGLTEMNLKLASKNKNMNDSNMQQAFENKDIVEKNTKLTNENKFICDLNCTLVNTNKDMFKNNEMSIQTLVKSNQELVEQNNALLDENKAIVIFNQKCVEKNQNLIETNQKLAIENKRLVKDNTILPNEKHKTVHQKYPDEQKIKSMQKQLTELKSHQESHKKDFQNVDKRIDSLNERLQKIDADFNQLNENMQVCKIQFSDEHSIRIRKLEKSINTIRENDKHVSNRLNAVVNKLEVIGPVVEDLLIYKETSFGNNSVLATLNRKTLAARMQQFKWKNGMMVLRIHNYRRMKEGGATATTKAFYCSEEGYKIFLKVTFDEEWIRPQIKFESTTSDRSLSEGFFHRRTFSILDLSDDKEKRDITRIEEPGFGTDTKTWMNRKTELGLCKYNLLSEHSKKFPYVKDDTIYVKVIVEPLSLSSDNCSCGFLVWTIDNYARSKLESHTGVNKFVHSHYFSSNAEGYRMQARMEWHCPTKNMPTATNEYISLYIRLLVGQNDSKLAPKFPYRCAFSIMNQKDSSGNNDLGLRAEKSSSEAAISHYISIPCSAVEKMPFLVEDKIVLKVVVGNLSTTVQN